MKLLDLTKCAENSPNFRRHLEAFEEATVHLERTLKRIHDLCQQRSELAAKDKSLMSSLIGEFESFAHHDLIVNDADEPVVQGSVDIIMVTLRQLVDNQDRLFEQLNLAIIKPLQHFLQNDVAQVKASKKVYHKALADAVNMTEKFCQCKRHEMAQMNELSYQLFDARFVMHRAACDYVLDLNSLHSKKTPDFLQRVVDLMTSVYSHYHVCNITTKEVNPIVEGLYQTFVRIRAEYTTKDTERRTQVQTLLEQVFEARAQDLLLFQQNDMNTPLEEATASIKQHLATNYSTVSYVPKELTLPETKLTTNRSKSGFLMYSEQRTFGTTWIRLYFSVKRGRLETPEGKAKVPISMQLNLCSVKLAEPSDSERNFCFKIISPVRTVLLQAENSKVLQEWIDVLTNAITYAIHHQQPASSTTEDTPTEDTPTSLENGGSSSPELDKPRSGAAIMRELQSIAGNELCADCHSVKPKWASVNLGVLICIECSGVHRSLGVHVSQVRSLTLDTMKPEWEKRLQEFGNKKSNDIYEELLPSSFNRGSLKNDQSRSQFIQDKYIAMKYTSSTNRDQILAERDESRTASLAKSKAATAAIIGSPNEQGPTALSSTGSSYPLVSINSSPLMTPPVDTAGSGGGVASSVSLPNTSTRAAATTDDIKSNGKSSADTRKAFLTKSSNHSSSTTDTDRSLSVTATASGGTGSGSSGSAGRMLQKWSKSFENVKDSVIKFAKNET